MSTTGMDFSQRLTQHAHLIEAHLGKLLGEAVAESTPRCGRPEGRLAAAMMDAAANGGKRLRPLLVIESAALFDVEADACCNAAAALECVHCYSLVHDDLPCMDNDELRRGKPTIWKAYDEWTAVLTGDALLTFAFEILSRQETHASADTRLKLVATLATASGAKGMVQGQALDLAASKLAASNMPTVAETKMLQALKTGALIEAACQFGGLLGGADNTALAHLKRYGAALGLAFQIRDDLLDVEGAPEHLGKATGKDGTNGKATLVSLLGAEAARAELDHALQDANAALAPFGAKGDVLRQAAQFAATRQH